MNRLITSIALVWVFSSYLYAKELSSLPRGPYPVATTNMEIAEKFSGMTDEEMHEHLLGDQSIFGSTTYVTSLLKHPESAWLIDVVVPDDTDLYGPVSDETIEVVSYVTYPTEPISKPAPYDFPYHSSNYGAFEHMLAPQEKPELARRQEKFPLVILSHGSSAHGIYDIEHANGIARHGYIVAVITYGEDRFQRMLGSNDHLQFLRPLITRSVIDSLLASEEFGPYIDKENIAISGFSFGGFTALATAGGKVNDNAKTAHHPLISAAVITAPWTGGVYGGFTHHAFGPDNRGLSEIDVPVMALFGSQDEVTPADFLFPAIEQLKGPTYVVELVDQTHNFEAGSWEDRNNWELLFLNAYLKDDPEALAALKSGESMQSGNADRQLFEYQRTSDEVAR